MAVLAVIQSAIISYLPFLDGTPNPILLAVVSWSLVGHSREAMIWGLFGGIFLDMLSGLPVGSTSIALVLIAYLTSLLEGGIWESHFFTPLVVMLFSSLIFFGFTLLTLFLSGRSLDLTSSLTRILLPSLFLNLILAIPSFHLAEWISNLIYPDRATA